jgi:hypothetical protein
MAIWLKNMESLNKDPMGKDRKPSCFGDESKFIGFLENSKADSECALCSNQSECEEEILLNCSRDLIF